MVDDSGSVGEFCTVNLRVFVVVVNFMIACLYLSPVNWLDYWACCSRPIDVREFSRSRGIVCYRSQSVSEEVCSEASPNIILAHVANVFRKKILRVR